MKATEEETNSLLQDLDLDKKRNVQAKKLSGGMRRKLSVLLALIGKAKVIKIRKNIYNNYIFLTRLITTYS